MAVFIHNKFLLNLYESQSYWVESTITTLIRTTLPNSFQTVNYFAQMAYNSTRTLFVFMVAIDDDCDENEFSGSTFITTTMLLIITMFANDLNLSVEYINKMHSTDTFDIYVNFNDENDALDNSSLEFIWPLYQNRYCFIYANTRIVPPEQFIYNELNIPNISALVSFFIGLALFYSILRARGYQRFDAFGRAHSYSMQSQTMSSFPASLDRSPERWLIGSKLIHNLLIGTFIMSVFATHFTVPSTRPATDREMYAINGYSYGPIQDFGIGEPCLFELVHGHYLRRGCLIACDIANSSVQKHAGIVFLREEINFQHMLKVDKNSKYFVAVQKLARRYSEAGLIERIFADIHKNSYKYLESVHSEGRVRFSELFPTIRLTLSWGYLIATITFGFEILIFRLFFKK